jgi:signal transduction histidine kinase
LTVQDDGRGLVDPAGARQRGSVGLELLEQLVTAHGGTSSVVSQDGTLLTVTLPVPER